jgi:hypothetical protein
MEEQVKLQPELSSVDDGRREFLKKCGVYGAATPPAMTMMLSVLSKPALAKGSGGGHGHGHGGKP